MNESVKKAYPVAYDFAIGERVELRDAEGRGASEAEAQTQFTVKVCFEHATKDWKRRARAVKKLGGEFKEAAPTLAKIEQEVRTNVPESIRNLFALLAAPDFAQVMGVRARYGMVTSFPANQCCVNGGQAFSGVTFTYDVLFRKVIDGNVLAFVLTDVEARALQAYGRR
jgi:hypothetical protein